jgi:exonuclease III
MPVSMALVKISIACVNELLTKSKILTDVKGSDHAPIKLNITFKK